MRSMVGPQFHYIRNEKLGEELYDWHTDPLENHDLAKDSKLSPVLQTFRESFKQSVK